MRIAVCHAQVPFETGGAEVLAHGLVSELQRRGHSVELVQLPYAWTPRRRLLQSCFAWRLMDLRIGSVTSADLVIGTKFPSYFVRHPNKSLWLVHQYRQAYDLAGTAHSDFHGGAYDRAWQSVIRRMDNRALREVQRAFSISKNVAARVKRYNNLEAPALYPPPPMAGRYYSESGGSHVLFVGRLEELKRPLLLIQALSKVPDMPCVLVGRGVLSETVRAEIALLNLSQRVTVIERATDEELLSLYARSRVVFYAPVDEDYGLVTIEAFSSGKPVITCSDSGGPLEFVEHGKTGWVAEPNAEAVAEALRSAWSQAGLCEEMGEAARDRVGDITWDAVVRALVPA
jgi:glycosyltransferase involved in cell wall biosynthesis